MQGANQNITITNDLPRLTVCGANHTVIIKSHVNTLNVSGMNNQVNGTDPNCLVNNISVGGMNNEVILNPNCRNASQSKGGMNNTISFGDGQYEKNIGNDYAQSNNNFQQFNFNSQNFFPLNNFAQYFNNQNNYDRNNDYNPQINIMNFSAQNNNNVQNDNNNVPSNNNNNAQNNNNNAQNNNNNVQNNNNNNAQNNNNNNKKDIFASTRPGEEDYSNLTDRERKIRQLFLEMDEYQYKHIQKYESRKETECAICLEEFKGTDMIKAFHKCEHIFHKNCLRDWLKKQIVCPLCKHDLEEDIKKMQ